MIRISCFGFLRMVQEMQSLDSDGPIEIFYIHSDGPIYKYTISIDGPTRFSALRGRRTARGQESCTNTGEDDVILISESQRAA